MRTLTIEVQPTTREGKTRRFSATLLAYINADQLWDGGRTDTSNYRPVYLAVGGPETTLRPFLANLRGGRRAGLGISNYRHSTADRRFELLRSAGYEYAWQRLDNGNCIVTAYLPELFVVDPGMVDPHGCRFVSAPAQWWANRVLAHLRDEGTELPAAQRHADALGLDCDVESDAPLAIHFALYLDRRTRRPLINTVAFGLQLYHAAHAAKLAMGANNARRIEAWGTDQIGLCPHTLMHASHSELDELLAEQVRIYREVTCGQA